MLKWILLGLALAGGLVGGVVALSGGSGGGSNGGSANQVIMAAQADDSHNQQTNVNLAHNINELDINGEETYYPHDHHKPPKEPPDMVPGPAPVLGGYLFDLLLLLAGFCMHRRWNHQVNVNNDT